MPDADFVQVICPIGGVWPKGMPILYKDRTSMRRLAPYSPHLSYKLLDTCVRCVILKATKEIYGTQTRTT